MSKKNYVQEYNAIVEVLNKYIEGNVKGSSAAMRPAFHEKATIFGFFGDEMLGPEIQKLYAVVDTLPPSPNPQVVIARIDIEGTAANARVDSDNVAGSRFTDFFNLLKIDGKWVIVNKIYHIYPNA